MGYPLSNTANPLTFARKALADARKAGITVVHCREGHLPDLSDFPYNKILRSKTIGKDAVGIGEKPAEGVGRFLPRGSRSWGIVKEVELVEGEILVDKAGKGVGYCSDFFLVLAARYHTPDLMRNHYRTLVCVHTIIRKRMTSDIGACCS